MYVGSYKTIALSNRVYTSGKRQLCTKVTYIFRCESCKSLFERRKRKAWVTNDMCSATCRRRETCAGGILRAAAVQTFKTRHGLGAEGHDLFAKKRRHTNLERYGHESSASSPAVRQKFIDTSLKRYGTAHPMQSSEVKRGIDHAAITVKRHATMKHNGTYGKSKVEDRLHEQLCAKFGAHDVERGPIVNGWSIDFHVKSCDTYVQLDGVYWHGLNRPLEQIEASSSPRDKVILTTRRRDIEQNTWFSTNGLRLVRVTDKQFKMGEVPL